MFTLNKKVRSNVYPCAATKIRERQTKKHKCVEDVYVSYICVVGNVERIFAARMETI
jgi:hypothetical protein